MAAKKEIKPRSPIPAETDLAKISLQMEKEWEKTFDGINDGICLLSVDQKILRCNRATATIVGKRREEIVGRYCFEVVHGTKKPVPDCPITRMRKSLMRETMELERKGRWFDVTVDPVLDETGELTGILHIVRDITERKKTEELLRESEEKYRTLVESSPEMIYFIDEQGTVRYVNNTALAMFKGGREAVIGKHLRDLYPPAIAEQHHQVIRAIIKSGRPVSHEFLEEFPTGKRWIDARLSPVRDSKGTIIGVLGLSADITERKQMEQELIKSREHYQDLVETAQDLILQLNAEGKYVYLNPAWEQVLGYTLDEMLGHPFTEFMPEENAQQGLKDFTRLLGKGVIIGYETVYQAKDGRHINLIFNAKYTKGPDGAIDGMSGSAYDITERKKMEERMARDEKIESLQVLAGGIAHDFNNLLAGIFGNIELARVELPDDNPAQHYLNNSFMAFGRAKHLAQQLLTFAKGGAPQKRALRLPELIMNACTLVLSGANVKAEFRFASGLWPVEVDENQLSQVFSNLILNAWQAMPQGGTLTIAAENRTIEEGQVAELHAGKYVVVAVEDRGIGIPATIIDKIFDPFFTTKQQGSGLGLATSYSIISSHGGTIEVASEPGRGTVFTIWLPATEKAVADDNEACRTPDLRGSGRILIMDDEGLIRRIGYDMLSMAGYEVTTATDGREVIKKYHEAFETGKRFDALILDLTVPGGMGGMETIKEILKIDPSALAIVSSGYSDTDVMADFAEHGFAARVPKPYSLKELLSTVKKVLESSKK